VARKERYHEAHIRNKNSFFAIYDDKRAGRCNRLTLFPEVTAQDWSRSKKEKKKEDPRITEAELQSQVMGFADRFAVILSQSFEDFKKNAPSPKAQLTAHDDLAYSMASVFTIAANPNPQVAMLDMAALATMGRMVYEEHWLKEWGEAAAPFVRGYRQLEAEAARGAWGNDPGLAAKPSGTASIPLPPIQRFCRGATAVYTGKGGKVRGPVWIRSASYPTGGRNATTRGTGHVPGDPAAITRRGFFERLGEPATHESGCGKIANQHGPGLRLC
jgi:hypothetical protein